MIKKYELMYIVDQDVNESELKDINKKMDAILTETGGKVIESEAWGLKDFAYKINHKKKGFYFIEIVETNAENIVEFERVAKIDKRIVRSLIINTEKDHEYIQSTKLSKTDMSKFEEEHREKRNFKRPERFEKSNFKEKTEFKTENRADKTGTKPFVKKPATQKSVKEEK